MSSIGGLGGSQPISPQNTPPKQVLTPQQQQELEDALNYLVELLTEVGQEMAAHQAPTISIDQFDQMKGKLETIADDPTMPQNIRDQAETLRNELINSSKVGTNTVTVNPNVLENIGHQLESMLTQG